MFDRRNNTFIIDRSHSYVCFAAMHRIAFVATYQVHYFASASITPVSLQQAVTTSFGGPARYKNNISRPSPASSQTRQDQRAHNRLTPVHLQCIRYAMQKKKKVHSACAAAPSGALIEVAPGKKSLPSLRVRYVWVYQYRQFSSRNLQYRETTTTIIHSKKQTF